MYSYAYVRSGREEEEKKSKHSLKPNVVISPYIVNGFQFRKEFWNPHPNSNKMDMVS